MKIMSSLPALAVRVLKPRNLFATLARKRHGGRHKGQRRQGSKDDKDLLQRLREAGL